MTVITVVPPTSCPFGFFPKNLGGVCVGEGAEKEEGSGACLHPFLGMGLRVWKAMCGRGPESSGDSSPEPQRSHFGVHPSTDSRTSELEKVAGCASPCSGS